MDIGTFPKPPHNAPDEIVNYDQRIPVEGGAFKGMDALLSTVQMPGGIPVAAVGVGSGGATNAALLAAQMLAIEDDEVRRQLAADRQARREKVIAADRELNGGA